MKITTLAIGGLIATMATGTSLAQTRRPAALVGDIAACCPLSDSAARLACYDRIVALLESATARREMLVIDRDEIRQTRRSLFGFALPRIALFGDLGPQPQGVDDREDISTIDTVITAVQPIGGGKYQLRLAEGGLWRSTDTWPAGGRQPTAGAKITIRRAAMGSYFLKIDGGRAVRGMRVG